MPSSKIETVLHMIEAHFISEPEPNIISLDFFLLNAEYMQPRGVEFDLEQIP